MDALHDVQSGFMEIRRPADLELAELHRAQLLLRIEEQSARIQQLQALASDVRDAQDFLSLLHQHLLQLDEFIARRTDASQPSRLK